MHGQPSSGRSKCTYSSMFAEQASQACIAVGFRIALRGVPAELSLGVTSALSPLPSSSMQASAKRQHLVTGSRDDETAAHADDIVERQQLAQIAADLRVLKGSLAR